MTSNKLKINDSKFDINLVFYNFLKKITQANFTDNQINDLLKLYYSNSSKESVIIKELLYSYVEDNIKRKDLSAITTAIVDISNDNINLFIFALMLISFKKLLLQEANVTQHAILHKLEGLDQLSLEYDKVSTQAAYATRISGALLSLLFFEKLEKGSTNFISSSTTELLANLCKEYKIAFERGVEPNQVFMLLFSESMNQSITSNAGVSYEDRIKSILISIGIPNDDISKIHDATDSSTEFDFFFQLNGRKFGIGAKRTLRERYKQFIKTSHMAKLDIMIEITLGIDLRENIAQSIINHGVYLFVADEIYDKQTYLQKLDGVFPATKLTINTLKSLK